MFGKNEVVGKAYFKDKTDYFVTSIFPTIQGEGPLAGIPSIFIRLAKCNLNCSFCDTYFDNGDWMSMDAIHEKIEKILYEKYGSLPLWVSNKEMALILTGGEPSLQNIKPLLKSFEHYKYTQIESNWILFADIPDSTILVVSPKCSEKTMKYLEPNFKTMDRANCLKFVVSAEEDSPYHTIPDWAFEWRDKNPMKDIYISPMNMYNKLPAKSNGDLDARSGVDEVISFWEPGLLDLAKNQANHEYVGEFVMKHGFKVNLQMHLFLGKA